MPESCTCGTTLVDNARFCHQCGRPTFETPAELTSAISEPPPEVPATAKIAEGPLPVSFRNPVALRVAFLMSVGIILIEMIPGVQLFLVLWWLAAGWGAVLLYRRLTGFALSVKAGARLGSITGILIFLGMMVILAFTMAVTGKEVFQEMVKQNPQISPVLDDPAELVVVVLIMLFLIFAVVVGTCAAGGALAARFARRGGASDTHAV